MNSKSVINILVVDDNYIERFICRKLIESFKQFKIIFNEATNGIEAIQFIRSLCTSNEKLPDLILLDLDMPVLGGFGFIEAFRQMKIAQNKIQIAIVSSSDNPRDILQSAEMGIRHFSKPISREEMNELILTSLVKRI
jgi:CheY-like chemotaxis protein